MQALHCRHLSCTPSTRLDTLKQLEDRVTLVPNGGILELGSDQFVSCCFPLLLWPGTLLHAPCAWCFLASQRSHAWWQL
jgi:hypothetical protein